MRNPIAGSIALVTIILILSVPVMSQVPHLISVQGRAVNASLKPLDGEQSIKFIIYGSVSGTDSLWSSGEQSVQVDDGLFTYQLGSHVALPPKLLLNSRLS